MKNTTLLVAADRRQLFTAIACLRDLVLDRDRHVDACRAVIDAAIAEYHDAVRERDHAAAQLAHLVADAAAGGEP